VIFFMEEVFHVCMYAYMHIYIFSLSATATNEKATKMI